MLPKVQELKDLGVDTNNWQKLVTDNKKQVFIDSKKSGGGLLTMRA